MGPAVERCDQILEAAREEFGVGIEEEDVASVGRFQSDVVGGAEAVVGAADRAGSGKALFHIGGRAIAAVVDDDHVEVQIARAREERAQRGVEPALAVVGDDDRADVVHTRINAPPRPELAGSDPSWGGEQGRFHPLSPYGGQKGGNDEWAGVGIGATAARSCRS